MIRSETRSLPALVGALRSGALPLDQYLSELEDRFESLEPQLLAFLPETGRFARLREAAEQLQARFPEAASRPALFGLPVGVKDIFHADGFLTQAGSRLPPVLLAGSQAHSVKELLDAGALILGKTVTTEFAYFAPGPTRNPHNPSHTPGGSSSGSAAAVAAGLAPLALGTQTIGSIIRPASFCGVVGFKPSYDRISRDGVIPLAPSVDHIGFFTPDVAGAALVASILCLDWNPAADGDRPVLGIPEGPYLGMAEPEGRASFEQACLRLSKAGYEIRRVPAFEDFAKVHSRHNRLVAAEASQVHAEWFATYEARYDPKTVELIRRGQAVPAGELEAALAGRFALQEALLSRMADYEIDLWISPAATGPAPQGLDSTGNPVMNLPWTHSGLPTVNLPMDRNPAGLPLGLQVAGGWYADESLLAWAEAMAQAITDKEV